MNRSNRIKTLDCVHCGQPQAWVSVNAARAICPACISSAEPRRHSFPRSIQDELFAQHQPEEVVA